MRFPDIARKGLRNPWRPSFDRATGDLYIVDVGQDAWEEVDCQPANSVGAENYGWDCRERAHCSIDSGCFISGCDCATVISIDPVHEYTHGEGRCSITGGYVYRGCAIPSLLGTYFYSDYCTGQIWTFRYDGVSLTEFTDQTAELPAAGPNFSIVSFGENAAGELYIVNQGGGRIDKIVAECVSDLDGDGSVNVADLLALLAAWGPNLCQVADTNGDGDVNVTDLLALLAAWGACP